jgi:hypothetical protein
MNKKGRKKISDNKIATIVRLREEGCTYEQICDKLSCGNSTISRYTIAQPTPIPVNVPKRTKNKRGWEAYAETLEAEETNDSNTMSEISYVNFIIDRISGASHHVIEQVFKLVREDKLNQELNDLHVEYMDKEEAIRGKYSLPLMNNVGEKK